jgi:NADH:ubiquinone oxidoreductase subunit 6 (subunit J)
MALGAVVILSLVAIMGLDVLHQRKAREEERERR